MKKLLFLITAILSLGTAAIAGCNADKDKSGDTAAQPPYTLQKTADNDTDGECPDGNCPDYECPDGNCPDKECPDGNCTEESGDSHDFRFRTPRKPRTADVNEENEDGAPIPAPRKPRKRNGHGGELPLPAPAPHMPKNAN